MNTLPTYTEQFNKITEAYIKGEILPYNGEFCFCGTLAGGDRWELCEYDLRDLRRMEAALLMTIRKDTIGFIGEPVLTPDHFYQIKEPICFFDSKQNGEIDGYHNEEIDKHPNYETALFNGMSAALEVLRQIHIEHGEVIDETPVFTKRQLAV